MTWEQLKQAIGERAKDIIHADKADGIGKLVCWMTAHASDPELDWSSGALHFRCHNCGEFWDILDHAKEQAGGDNKKANEILHEYAGIEMDQPKAETAAKPKPIEWEGIEPISRERSTEMVQYMLSRGISESTLKRYHVTGTHEAMFFNYVCDKTLVKIKGRLIGSHANGRDKYSPTPKGGVNTLYGQHTYKKQDVLVICEGEVDALSVFEAVSSRGADIQISVSSVPSGSSSFGWIENSLPYILKHRMVIVVPDNDEAGKKFANKLQSELSQHVRMACAKFDKVNDMNDLLQLHGADSVMSTILDAEEYSPGYTVDWRKLEQSKTTHSTSGFFTLDRMTYGLQHGLITLFTGRSGDGKTTILRQIIAAAIKRNERVGALMGEESPLMFRELFLYQAFGKDTEYIESFTDSWGNTRYYATDAGINVFEEKIVPHISIFDNDMLPKPDSFKMLLAWIKREATIFGTKLFILDNLMKLESGADGQLLESQRHIANQLKIFAEALQIHIILVAHPRKDTSLVTVDSISGSKNVSNVVDNVVIFQRIDNLADDVRATCTENATNGQNFGEVTAYMLVAKNRHAAQLGHVVMRYDPSTKCIYDINLSHGRDIWTIGRTTEEDQW